MALVDRNDKYHLASIKFIKDNNSELVTTLASITETLHLLDFNINSQIDFLSWVSTGAVTLEPITSLVFLGEKLNINTIATIDRDFDIYRLKGKKAFTTLIKRI